MNEGVFTPAHELAEAMRRREVSSVEVVDAYLVQIARNNPDLNAIVTLDEDGARVKAQEADAVLGRGGGMGISARRADHSGGCPPYLGDAFDLGRVTSSGRSCPRPGRYCGRPAQSGRGHPPGQDQRSRDLARLDLLQNQEPLGSHA